MIQHGASPFLECSSRGERRLSAFSARIAARGGRSIEDVYQGAKIFADGSSGLGWRAAKGRNPVNREACSLLYASLWDEYIGEHPELLALLTAATGLADMFGQPGRCCQATELWRIRGAALGATPAARPAPQTAAAPPDAPQDYEMPPGRW